MPIRRNKPPEQGNLEETLFPKVDGIGDKGEYIDIDPQKKDRLFIRYSPIADLGVELERVRGDVILWRVHTKPLGVSHSKYNHEVRVTLGTRFLSRGIGNRTPTRVFVTSLGAKEISEVRELASGKLLSRTIS